MFDNGLDLQHTNWSFIEEAFFLLKWWNYAKHSSFQHLVVIEINKRFTSCSYEEWGISSTNLFFSMCLRETKILNASRYSYHIKRQEKKCGMKRNYIVYCNSYIVNLLCKLLICQRRTTQVQDFSQIISVDSASTLRVIWLQSLMKFFPIFGDFIWKDLFHLTTEQIRNAGRNKSTPEVGHW